MSETIHPLRQYRASNGITLAAMAKMASTTEATLSRIENGLNTPSFDLAARIKDATNGAVTPNDFLERIPQPQQAAE